MVYNLCKSKVICTFAPKIKKRVKISFGTKKLEEYASDEKKRIKKLGPLRAGLYKQRLDDLYAASTEEIDNYHGK